MTEDEKIILQILREIKTSGTSASGGQRHFGWMMDRGMIDSDEAQRVWHVTDEGEKFFDYLVKTEAA